MDLEFSKKKSVPVPPEIRESNTGHTVLVRNFGPDGFRYSILFAGSLAAEMKWKEGAEVTVPSIVAISDQQMIGSARNRSKGSGQPYKWDVSYSVKRLDGEWTKLPNSESGMLGEEGKTFAPNAFLNDHEVVGQEPLRIALVHGENLRVVSVNCGRSLVNPSAVH